MSSNDKTRQKLVDTMRRTKVSATKKAAPKAKVAAEAKQEPTKKPAPAAKRAPAKKAPQKATAKVASPATADPYQSGHRIWPD